MMIGVKALLFIYTDLRKIMVKEYLSTILLKDAYIVHLCVDEDRYYVDGMWRKSSTAILMWNVVRAVS